MAAVSLQHAIVKSVISGDTLVVKPLGPILSTDESEQKIILNHIIARKLAQPPDDSNTNKGSIDEPYSFEAREYLRKRLVGHEIWYSIDFYTTKSHRPKCTVYLGKDTTSDENIIESLLSQGLVVLKRQKGEQANNATYQRLIKIKIEAEKKQYGLHSKDSPSAHIRDMKWKLENPKEFFDLCDLSVPLNAIVEHVRDGNTLRCLLLPSYQLGTIKLTGVKCPTLKHDDSSINQPYAEEARQKIEKDLLQQDVQIRVEGVDRQSLLGTVFHNNENIALVLLREGLAKYVDSHERLLSIDLRNLYRAAEENARIHRLKIWEDCVSNLDSIGNQTVSAVDEQLCEKYQAKVLEIINGDALVVRDLSNNTVKRIYLSFVRSPRAADFQENPKETDSNLHQQQIKRPLYEVPFILDARELLRKHLIGQTVRVVTDAVQPANQDYPEKVFCTVYIKDINIAAALISQGLAKAMRLFKYDNKILYCNSALLAAEEKARKNSLGIYSCRGGIHRIADMTGESNKARAKTILNVLQRNGLMEGIVEYVATGSRFRIHLLRENWIISLFLSSITCPRFEHRSSSGEPFGFEALNFSKENFLQRDVLVEVENMDRGGNFIGHLTTRDGQSVALMLVQAGLAKLNDSAHHASNYEQLSIAEKNCRIQRIGLWINHEESLDDDNKEANNSQDESNYHRVVLTYISSEMKFYFQYSEHGQKLVEEQNGFREILNQTKPVDEHRPQKGELLAACSAVDNEWYRARVKKIDGKKGVSVDFIDYGNREVITEPHRLRALPINFSQLPNQAHQFAFANVRVPSKEKYREAFKTALLKEIGDNECLIKIEYEENDMKYILLYNIDTKENIITKLVEQGLILKEEPLKPIATISSDAL